MKLILFALMSIGFVTHHAYAEATPSEKQFYRELVLKIRTQGEFKIAFPNETDQVFKYQFEFDQPKWEEPKIAEHTLYQPESIEKKYIRFFWDKIFTKEGSYIELGGEQIPLTCVYVSAQDNRFSDLSSPSIPEFVLKVYLVTNDWMCTGPLNPGWPSDGGKKEAWGTYLHYSVNDPTIMLPVDAVLRYRWSEYESILVQ